MRHPSAHVADVYAEPTADLRSTQAAIPPNVLVHLLRLAEQRGVPSEPWFAGMALERAQVLDPRLKVSYRQAAAVIRRALRGFAAPGLGLDVGRMQTVGCFGVLGLAMMTARTFGDAMRVGVEHHRVCGCLVDVGFEELAGDEVALALWPRYDDPDILPFLAEELFASSFMIARELLGDGFRLERIELTYPVPAYAGRYAEVFGGIPVRFGAPHNRAVVHRHWLAQPLPGYHPLTERQAIELCRTQLAQARGADEEIVAAVERLLRERLHEHPRIEDVAHALHLSGRALRRRLAAAGRAFREIHDEVRTERALQLLRGGRLSVADIGSELGFSDPREFRRAFKRWTGRPPQAMRAAPPRAGAGTA